MHERLKVEIPTSLKLLTDPVDLTDQPSPIYWWMVDAFSTWLSGDTVSAKGSPCRGKIDEHRCVFFDTQATNAVIQRAISVVRIPCTMYYYFSCNLIQKKGRNHWMLLQSLFAPNLVWMDSSGSHDDEQIRTLHLMAPEQLLSFTSCNCKDDCNNRSYS